MARSNKSKVLTDIQTLLNKQEENIKHHIDEVRDELRLFKSAIDKLFMELQQVKQRQEDSGVRAFYRGDRLVVGGPLHQNTNRQQEEREKPRTNADSSPSQHQTTLQHQTDEYTLTTAQRNNGVRQHRSSQSYLPLEPLSTSAINTNAATGRGATVENRHSKRIQCTPTTIIHALGNISNNLQMIPTAILPTKCPSESSITNTSTSDNTKGKDTHPYTRITEANNSQTADVSSGCPPDSNVQVSSPHPASVSSASRDPETTHGVPVLTSRRKNKNGGASEKGKKQGSLDSYISDKNTSDSATRSQPKWK
ncbi:hypothetical protein C0Q70_05399 [Pomacea canaliculata]|uniref:Uncharacterized protein n=1 Tax=Pomacea canaliculata TaxID=400727 RepID=A0A2T7PL30_POMCA|nr:hypothetical protein C0Q70_05399 [Pomacea canaliculata]